MMKNFGIAATSANVELGKGGPRVKATTGVVEVKNNIDNAYAIMRGADPQGVNDFVTLQYFNTRSSMNVAGQIDGGTPPVVINGAIYICTTAGVGYLINRLYVGVAGTWTIIPWIEGKIAYMQDAYTGYLADHLYGADTVSGTWIDLGPATFSVTKVNKNLRALVIQTDSGVPVNVGAVVPVGSIITKIIVDVGTAWDGTTPSILEIGDVTLQSRLAATGDTNLDALGVYEVNCYYEYTGITQITALVTNGAAVANGSAKIYVEYGIN